MSFDETSGNNYTFSTMGSKYWFVMIQGPYMAGEASYNNHNYEGYGIYMFLDEEHPTTEFHLKNWVFV